MQLFPSLWFISNNRDIESNENEPISDITSPSISAKQMHSIFPVGRYFLSRIIVAIILQPHSKKSDNTHW